MGMAVIIKCLVPYLLMRQEPPLIGLRTNLYDNGYGPAPFFYCDKNFSFLRI